MERRIAIEPDLVQIQEYLSGKGYNVDMIDYSEMHPENAEKYDAFIVTGMNSKFLGISDTNSNAIIIDARGMTAEDIHSQLKSRLQ